MRIVVTGASGFVGSQLVPLLAAAGDTLLLVGRDSDALAAAFPGHPACRYDQIAERGQGFDALLHLAVLNNDVDAPRADFAAVNVELTADVLAAARQAEIPRFVNVSSTHALDPRRTDPYATTKRDAADRLREEPGATTLYLPLVYGTRWGGRLARLNRLPRPLARLVFSALAALKPVVHAGRIAQVLHADDLTEPELLVSDGQDANPVYLLARKVIDLAFALVVIVLFWWLLLVLWAAVRLQTRGPGIFAQNRVGRGGRTFRCFKFRTMAVGTAEVGTHDAPVDAITPIGHFLRRTKLDELPQAVNVLLGQVSVTGPRPCLPVQTELVAARRRRGVLRLTPGITGLAQIHGVDMSDPERLARWDSHYAAMQSLPLDLRLMIGTVRRPRARPGRVVPGCARPFQPRADGRLGPS